MRRDDVIAKTFAAMRHRGDRTAAFVGCNEEPDDDEIVASELQRRLLTDDLTTCEDFAHLNVSCCETCHTLYPHYDMYVHALPEGDRAWICCRIRSALLAENASPELDNELVDLVEVLRGARS